MDHTKEKNLTRIFVGNLAFQATEADIRSTFERYGRVSSVQLVSDRVTGKSRGFAFVGMPRLDDADEAMTHLNGRSLHGRPLVVNEARDRQAAPTQPTPNRWHLI